MRSRPEHTCAAARCRQTAVQQVQEQHQAIEAGRSSVLGFKGDIEQMKKTKQVWSMPQQQRCPGLHASRAGIGTAASKCVVE